MNSIIRKTISDFIFAEIEVENPDLILIPGGSDDALAYTAARIFHETSAQVVIPSGAYNPKRPTWKSEADHFAQVLIDQGVPASHIYGESCASNTLENAKFSLKLIEGHGVSYSRCLLVCKSFHARRALLTYAAIFPSSTKWGVRGVLTKERVSRDNWFENKHKIEVVFEEIEKIGAYFPEILKLTLGK